MFHTFQAASTANSNASSSKNNPKTRRQSSTTHACEECRRRKIRCDGKQPCSHCEWYKHPKLCKYSKKQPRVVPSQKLLDELSTSLRQSQKVLEQLFPNSDLTQIGDLPREELIGMILSASTQRQSSSSASPHTGSDAYTPSLHKSEDVSANLEALEQEPSPDANWDESKVGPSGIPSIPDDVNALSMSVSRQSSYLGVSSVAAALRVISKINKALEHVILSSPSQTAQPTRSSSPRRAGAEEVPVTISAPTLTEASLIDAYFQEVHPLIPMIDEVRFRYSYQSRTRTDPSWLALLNMVCAMGTIAASTADDNSHLIFYHRAKQCIDLDMFGNGHIEAVQALGLMGGFYLHYESRPNMANAIMGAAMRMACALGLHREYAEGPSNPRPDFIKRALLIPREVRRRTWWSLFCLDTWATTTTGRPSLGRISPAVTVQPPTYLAEAPDMSKPLEIGDEDVFVIILCHEISFCKIATRIQDRLAEQPLLPVEETARFDVELRNWHETLPPLLKPTEKCPPVAFTPRAIMNWRYNNLRLVLHRPLLLNNALRSSLDPGDSISDKEALSVATCRQIAAKSIDDIRLQWRATQMSGWNAVWLLFQACMAPLVTLFAEFNRSNLKEVRTAQVQIEAAIMLFTQMSEYSITAKKTRHFMIKIYEHSRSMINYASNLAAAQQAATIEQTNAMARLGVGEAGYGAHQHPGQNPMNIPTSSTGMHGMYEDASMLRPGSSISHPGITNVLHPGVGMGVPHMHPHEGINGTGSGFMNEGELNAFWNQIMWGEGDMPDFMMDTTYDMAPFDPNAPHSAPPSGSGFPDYGS